MANVVRLPYSNTSGNVPSTLGNGVLGINQASGSLYYRNSSGAVTQFTSAASLADGYVFDCGEYVATVITITSQPTNQTASNGSATFSISATATNNATPTYQWQKQSLGVGTWSDIAGATSSTLSLTGLVSGTNNTDNYRCFVSASGALAAVQSNTVVLTVPSRISITSQPTNQTTSGTTATFSLTATISGSGTLSYQWYRQALGTGAFNFIANATSATLSLTGLSSGSNNGDKYYCAVSSSGETSVASDQVTLTVTGSASLLTISRNNGASTFTGAGTTGSPYTRATGYNLDATDGLSHYSWTATGSATVSVTLSYRDDDGSGNVAAIYKNGSQVGTTIADGATVTRSFSVVSTDVVTIGVPGSPAANSQYFFNVSVSAA